MAQRQFIFEEIDGVVQALYQFWRHRYGFGRTVFEVGTTHSPSRSRRVAKEGAMAIENAPTEDGKEGASGLYKAARTDERQVEAKKGF